MKHIIGIILIFCAHCLISQTDTVFYNSSGKITSANIADHYLISLPSNQYKGFYASNGGKYFEGFISKIDSTKEADNQYIDKCIWYYKNGNLQKEIHFNAKGEKNGIYKTFLSSSEPESVKIFRNNNLVENQFKSFNIDGTYFQVFEDDFNTENASIYNYTTNASSSSIYNNELTIQSYTLKGTARFPIVRQSNENYIISTNINISTINLTERAGILFGFKDWNNYEFFLISPTAIYIGKAIEGKIKYDVEALSESAIRKDYNAIKIDATAEEIKYYINNREVYRNVKRKLIGNEIAIGFNGVNALKINQFSYQEFQSPLELLKTDKSFELLSESEKDLKTTPTDASALGSFPDAEIKHNINYNVDIKHAVKFSLAQLLRNRAVLQYEYFINDYFSLGAGIGYPWKEDAISSILSQNEIIFNENAVPYYEYVENISYYGAGIYLNANAKILYDSFWSYNGMGYLQIDFRYANYLELYEYQDDFNLITYYDVSSRFYEFNLINGHNYIFEGDKYKFTHDFYYGAGIIKVTFDELIQQSDFSNNNIIQTGNRNHVFGFSFILGYNFGIGWK